MFEKKEHSGVYFYNITLKSEYITPIKNNEMKNDYYNKYYQENIGK